MGPPWQTQLYGSTVIPQSHPLQSESLPCTASPDPSTAAIFFCSWPTLHKYSFTHHWQNYKSQFLFSPCLCLLNPFSTCTSTFSLFYCYVLPHINRCLSASDLWFAKPSPPYGSGEAILVFLVLQFSQECNFLGKRKKQNLKKRKQIFPFISKSIHPLLILVSLSECYPVIKTLADENIIEPCSSSEHYC